MYSFIVPVHKFLVTKNKIEYDLSYFMKSTRNMKHIYSTDEGSLHTCSSQIKQNFQKPIWICEKVNIFRKQITLLTLVSIVLFIQAGSQTHVQSFDASRESSKSVQ
jgi:hypothetical protein